MYLLHILENLLIEEQQGKADHYITLRGRPFITKGGGTHGGNWGKKCLDPPQGKQVSKNVGKRACGQTDSTTGFLVEGIILFLSFQHSGDDLGE